MDHPLALVDHPLALVDRPPALVVWLLRRPDKGEERRARPRLPNLPSPLALVLCRNRWLREPHHRVARLLALVVNPAALLPLVVSPAVLLRLRAAVAVLSTTLVSSRRFSRARQR